MSNTYFQYKNVLLKQTVVLLNMRTELMKSDRNFPPYPTSLNLTRSIFYISDIQPGVREDILRGTQNLISRLEPL
jgi:hypothetical protein